ncbi:2-oxo acid dehydrogenase subunit E2 [Gammaproteobacteria bacterium]|nr:2-oxo acid dehydrogenase subunit E2 [Gammaproteobacteria bacterium]
MIVIVPKENVNDDEVIVQSINFKSKDKVKKGDHIIDLETSKTAIEIESPCDGFLDIKVSEGDEISVGSVLFEVLESLDELKQNENNITTDNKSATNDGESKNYIFTKDAKNKIDELGLKDYSFDKKMVTLDDVLNFSNDKIDLNKNKFSDQKSIIKTPIVNESIQPPPNISFELKKHTLRKRSEIKNLSSNGNASTQSIIGITINTLPNRSYEVPFIFKDSIADLVTYEGSKLLKKYTQLNSFYINEKEYGEYNHINAGFSFDNDSNLKVLSIKEADKLSLDVIQNEVVRLLELYESNETIDEETLTSSTFTISDLSNTEASYMMPLVSKNQSSIIGITKVGNLFNIYIGFDHKITSGLYVSKYLGELKESIESHFYNENSIDYLFCSKCEMSAHESKSLGSTGFIKMIGFDGSELNVCENCFNGY